jgi:dephospho-CoA kinase
LTDFGRLFRGKVMFKLGLTGGIGSGKTHVANLLASWGATVVDTDLIAHQLTAPGGAAIQAIRECFGPGLIDAQGALDRGQMRELVFADPQRRIELEGILHPLIGEEVIRQAQSATGMYAVFVVPLLVESGRWRDRIDRLCVVDCEPETQIARVRARSGIPVETIRRIMAAQATRNERLAAADDIVANMESTSLADLEKQVLVLHKAWCNLAKYGEKR